MNDKMKDFFKKMAIETSKLSTCVSKHVGCVLVKDKRIISIGYNGVPSKKKHCNEIFDKDNFDRAKHHEWSLYNELHAEQNLISFCAKHGIPTNGTELFLTVSPCINCAKLIISTGIKKIYYVDEYDLESGLKFLIENGVECEKI